MTVKTKQKVRAKETCFFGKSRKKKGQVFEALIDDIKNYPFLELVGASIGSVSAASAVASGAGLVNGGTTNLDDGDEEKELTPSQKEKAIQDAVMAFDYADASLWTGQGLPQVSAVEDAVGFDVSRSDITAAVADYDKAQAEEKAGE